MKVRAVSLGILFLTLAFSPTRSHAQEPADVPRKALVKTPAAYPTLAQSMHIHGSVKVEAVISPNGTVKSVAVKGGHPILTQSAVTAVEHWKFEPSARETREMIEIKFEDQ